MLLIRQLRAITDPACLKRVHTHVGMIRCSKPSAVLLSTQSCMKQLVLYKHLGMTRIHAMVVHVGLGFSQDFSESQSCPAVQIGPANVSGAGQSTIWACSSSDGVQDSLTVH